MKARWRRATCSSTTTASTRSTDGGGRLVASGDLEFAAYWRPTWVESSALSFGKHATFPVAVTLVVQNDRGRAAKFSLNCTR